MALPGTRRDSRRCTPIGCAPPRRAGARAVALAQLADHARAQIITREVGRERAARAARHRRLDQRDHPPHGDRRPRSACTIDLQRLNAAVRLDAGAGRPQADRPALHGGPLRRRRRGRGAARAAAAAAPRLHDGRPARRSGERLDARRRLGRPRGGARRSTSRSPQVGGLVALFGSLAPNGAILKRSAADPTLFETRRPRGGVRARSTTSRRASTIRTSTSRPDDFLVLQNAGPKSRLRACRRRATCRSRRSSRAPA